MVGSQNRRRMSQIRQWQTCLHSSKSTWKMNAQVQMSGVFFTPPPALNMAKRRALSRICTFYHVENISRSILRTVPFSPVLLCVSEVVVVVVGVMCSPLDTQIPLCEEEAAGWEWLGPPDQSCWWVAWIHKSGSGVNLSQVLESQPSVNMLPQDRMGFKGFLSPKKN